MQRSPTCGPWPASGPWEFCNRAMELTGECAYAHPRMSSRWVHERILHLHEQQDHMHATHINGVAHDCRLADLLHRTIPVLSSLPVHKDGNVGEFCLSINFEVKSFYLISMLFSHLTNPNDPISEYCVKCWIELKIYILQLQNPPILLTLRNLPRQNIILIWKDLFLTDPWWFLILAHCFQILTDWSISDLP